MITRILSLADDHATKIPVRIGAPVLASTAGDWSCRVQIGWPDGTVVCEVGGVDGVQALQLAMQFVGTDLYCSDLHQSGRLMWLKPGAGYGFPVPRNIRNLLIGDDREMM